MSIWQIGGASGALIFGIAWCIYIFSGCKIKWAGFISCISLIVMTICVMMVDLSWYYLMFGKR